MILLLAEKYTRPIAFVFLAIFMLGLAPVYGNSSRKSHYHNNRPVKFASGNSIRPGIVPANSLRITLPVENVPALSSAPEKVVKQKDSVQIGGPSQPEMSSFKPAGAGELVNLFTGDFSYNIPLLDVGGYPVNIFYDGNVGLNQDASWCGLGWNINPGNVSRNMRGIPDDFNGEDEIVQTQIVKPNKTWGINLNPDVELVGFKALTGPLESSLSVSVGTSLGVSFNNYLGPALEFGLKGGLGFQVAGKVASEKKTDSGFALKVNVGLAATASSRYGLTLSPNVSLTASNFKGTSALSNGVSLSTSYNSRNGIKALQISEQTSFNESAERIFRFNSGEHTRYNRSTGKSIASGVSISFLKPSYVPAIRLPLTNTAWAGHAQLGTGIFGGYISAEVEVYSQKSEVADGDKVQKKPMVGYMYYQNAKKLPQAVMDFTRFNDKEVTSATTIISAPQYSYDVFTINGEGTGGMIRAYRNDYGYVRDNETRSKDKSLGVGADIGIPGHYGANVNIIKTPSIIGEWNEGNLLRNDLAFKESDGTWENVYFRNPGEVSVLHDDQFKKIGGTDLVRFKLGGTNTNPTVEPVLERFDMELKPLGTLRMATAANPLERKKRTQLINFLTAQEASEYGLDTKIKNYSATNILDAEKKLVFSEIGRTDDYRRPHHISQINVTESDGKRYVYGIPVYNTFQKDFMFSVEAETNDDLISFDEETEPYENSPHLQTSGKVDGYLNVTETPAYAHSFLLSGLLSPDYVDVKGDGITEDDLGTAVKFNYTETGIHTWRAPLVDGAKANFNPGNRTSLKDNKGIITYGKRESWYLHSLESKTMIAFFILDDRLDGKGTDTLTGININDNVVKKLDRIDLYSKADLRKNGLQNAKPIKSVHFVYSYLLCGGVPGNSRFVQDPSGATAQEKGKLTLEKIYFTFNGQTQSTNKSQYVFDYGAGTSNVAKEFNNPAYEFNAADRWGSYKPKAINPGGLKNADFPYVNQKNEVAQDAIDRNLRAGAWALKKILLPSGGQMEVEYESDDYAFVQDKRATSMMQIAGFAVDDAVMTNKLYDQSWPTMNTSNTLVGGRVENDKVYIHVPEACDTKLEVFKKYLDQPGDAKDNQLAFKLAVNMPKGEEFITSYAKVVDYGYVSNQSMIWVKLETIEGLTPLSLTSVEFLREQLPGQAYPTSDLSDEAGLDQVIGMLKGVIGSFKTAFQDPVSDFRTRGLAQSVDLSRSFVRLNEPDGRKYGGGHRVSKVVMKDNWDKMTCQYGTQYGQTYDYNTSETFNGQERIISSGVASYEPAIGGEENPFQSIVRVENKLPLGPTSYGAIEMPVLDAFFPSPLVGYSKVTVRSLNKNKPELGKKSRSGVGKQVTEFYTAKDFPVLYKNTDLKDAVKEKHNASLNLFLYKYAYDSKAISQGFLVATNDMHGKMKSQSSYAENDTTLRVNYTQNFYRNTGSKGLNEKFDFVYYNDSCKVRPGSMGIDIELMTDTREFSVFSSSWEIQAQVDLFPILFPIWLPFIWPVRGESENTYRAVTTTKVINYHSILDRVVVISQGSEVSTQNIVFDAETGDVVVNKTNNQFDKPVYSTNYPAYWAYSGMGTAYKNIDAVFTGVTFFDGKIVGGISETDVKSIFESGDELYLFNKGQTSVDNCGAKMESGKGDILWAFDKNKNSSSLTNPNPDLVFMDTAGVLYTKANVRFKIIRSGKRNMLGASISTVSQLTISPIISTPTAKIMIAGNGNVINASAAEYKEKWQVDKGVIKTILSTFDVATCTYQENYNCYGSLEKRINPYRKGLLGNFRPYRNMLFYGSRTESLSSVNTDLPNNGFLLDFAPYWSWHTGSGNLLLPAVKNTKWVWNSEIVGFNSRGLETETRDAMNIYTAALYGYNKSVPIAITNNGRVYEVFNENFEDYDYQDNLGKDKLFPCFRRHVDFSDMTNSVIINTQNKNIAAHTGNYMLVVNAGLTASKYFGVKDNAVDSFRLVNLRDTIVELNDPGGNVTGVTTLPTSIYQTTYNALNLYTSTTTTRDVYLDPADTTYVIGGTSHREHDAKGATIQYFKVPTSSNYQIEMSVRQTYQNLVEGMLNPDYYQSVMIYDSLNTPIPGSPFITYFMYHSVDQPYADLSQTVYLCAGVYRMEISYSNVAHWTDGIDHDRVCRYSFKMIPELPTYKSLKSQNSCFYLKPISATDSMQHLAFMPPAGKKMLFSAWVREYCGDSTNNTPCRKENYTDNTVQLSFSGGASVVVNLKPSGPIIDGWQRIEGEFTVPALAIGMTLSLINSSNAAIFYDDIRIHPFDGNMKSYVYDPVSLRLKAELDANNYATFYEYDDEGGLIRTKAETREGIKTIQETRSFKQKALTTVQ